MSNPKKTLVMYGKNAAKSIPDAFLGTIKFSPTRIEEWITKDEAARRGKSGPYIKKTKAGTIKVCVYYKYNPNSKGGLIEEPLTPEEEKMLYGSSFVMVGNFKPPSKAKQKKVKP